tara:strand:+ start:949 stop:1761 length:813 start_codon:yes stop_codon:yes gene_type:complete
MSILSAAANGAAERPTRSYAALCQAVERGPRVPISSSMNAAGASLVAFVPFRPGHAAAMPTKAHESVVLSLFENMDANETAPTAAPLEGAIAKKRGKKPTKEPSPSDINRKKAAEAAYDAAVQRDATFRANLLLSPAGTARGHLHRFVKMLDKITGGEFSASFANGEWSDQRTLAYFVTATKSKDPGSREQIETFGAAAVNPKSIAARNSALTSLRKYEVERIVTIWDAVATAYFTAYEQTPLSPDAEGYPYQDIANAALKFVAEGEDEQ